MLGKEHEKEMTDLHRLLATQNFNSLEEAKEFFNKHLTGQKIPSFPKEALTAKEQAQDLVFEVSKLPLAQAKAKIDEALKLDPDCIEAYESLGNKQTTPQQAVSFYEKGIAIGRRIFGGKYLEKHKGMFWGMHETRPFMRCLQSYSDCVYGMGKVKESLEILEEMITLNPNDNQGVRDQLLLLLIELYEREKFERYAKLYEDDGMAFALFTRALYAYKIEGKTVNSTNKLKEAMKQNKFVVTYLTDSEPPVAMPEMYGMGDEKEAQYYAYCAYYIWHKTYGAVKWLREQKRAT